jgi:5-methylcytosine-specific restriction endonuclease McrA
MKRGHGYKQPGNWRTTVRRILTRDAHKCYLCQAPAHSVDHITSVAAGGSHADHNLAAICPTCKANKDEADRLAGLARRRTRLGRQRRTEQHPNGG